MSLPMVSDAAKKIWDDDYRILFQYEVRIVCNESDLTQRVAWRRFGKLFYLIAISDIFHYYIYVLI